MVNRERDLLILVGVAWLLAGAGVAARGGGKKRAHAESDPLVRARCDLRCLDIDKPNKSECVSILFEVGCHRYGHKDIHDNGVELQGNLAGFHKADLDAILIVATGNTHQNILGRRRRRPIEVIYMYRTVVRVEAMVHSFEQRRIFAPIDEDGRQCDCISLEFAGFLSSRVTLVQRQCRKIPPHPLRTTAAVAVSFFECRSSCRESIVKPGSCPRAASREDEWSAACVVACSSDAHCEGIARCCTSACGAACIDPDDLHTLPGLPAVPVVWNVTERRRSSAVRWSAAVGDTARGVPGDVVYVLEEQHHLGPAFEQHELGEWTPLVRTSKMKASLKDILKAGRWYRFRVAAVSADGTRGFSEPSNAFTPRRGPRPPGPPRRPAVTRLHARRANMTALLEWRAPKSDLPLTRYKVFWSRRVRGIDGVLDSVLVNHQLVPPDQTYAQISNLEPNSMYFFQVQAIAQFGLTKLRSEKAATFFNTTSYENDSTTFIEQRKHSQKHKITGMKLNKMIWHNGKLKARVSWNPLPEVNGKPRRYMIQWWTGACERENKDHKSRKQLAATTQEHTFELYELSYGCKYRVYINRLPLPSRSQAAPEAVLRFAVPGCPHFQERLNGTIICHQPSP